MCADISHAHERSKPGGEYGILYPQALGDRLTVSRQQGLVEVLELSKGEQLDGQPRGRGYWRSVSGYVVAQGVRVVPEVGDLISAASISSRVPGLPG